MLKCHRLFNCQSGSVAVVAAVAIIPVLISVGCAVDYMRVFNSKTALQADIDALTLAGARIFIDAAGKAEADIRSNVSQWMDERLETLMGENGRSATFTYSLAVDADAKKVAVGIDYRLQASLLGLVGLGELKGHLTSAAAAELDSRPVCILALGGGMDPGLEFSGDGEMTAKDCVVWTNSNSLQAIKFNGRGKIKTERLCAVGRAGQPGQFKVQPAAEDNCTTIADPLADWSPPAVGACTTTSTDWITATTAQLDPGVYCGGLRVDAKNIFMKPGLYVIKDGPLILRGSSKIKGSDVGIVLTGAGARLDIDGKAKVEIIAAEDGDMAGIAIAADRSVTADHSVITGRADLKIGGVIYLPTQDIAYEGESDTRAASPVTTIIANTIKIASDAFLEVKNNKAKAKYAPVIETGTGTVRLVY